MAVVTYNNTLAEYENLIRVKLKVVNPTLIKSGALGILTNYLAGIKYDTFQLYSKSFQEMNVGLAQDFNSMLYHSTVFGTDISFAVPARLSSSLIIPEYKLSEVEEIVYTIPRYTTFNDTNSINFLFTSEIRVSIKNNGVKATSWDPVQGTQKISVTKAPNPNIPNSYVYLIHNNAAEQYVRGFQDFTVPAYTVGENYSFSIGIESINNIKEVRAWINTGTKLTSTEFDILKKTDPELISGSLDTYGASITELNIKFHKFGSSVRDQDIFLELFETSLNFETGDGTHGSILPAGAQLIIEVQDTKGIFGNIPNSEYLVTNVSVEEKFSNGYIKPPSSTTLNGLSTTGSFGGTNIEKIDSIRENIFNQINVRNSVITENDYERLFKYQDTKPFVDAKFIDAKAFVFLFNTIHENDEVVPTTSVNYPESSLIAEPFYPLYDYNGIELISPFYYKYNDLNTVDAYIVNPNIPFTLTEVITAGVDTTSDYRVDISLTYEFQRTQSGMTGKSYIEITGEVPGNYEYKFYCSWLGQGAYIPLNPSNNYKYEINTLYTDPYCIVRDKTEDILVEVFDLGTTSSSLFTPQLVASYKDNSIYHQLIKKQSFYKYYQDVVPDAPNVVTNNTVGFIDNQLAQLQTTVSDIFNTTGPNIEAYLLRLPYIDSSWFLGKSPTDIFEILDNYFIVNYVENNLNYNTQLTQAFHNTIDIPQKYYPYLFEETTMPILDIPKIDIELEVHLDKDKFLTSNYSTTQDFEIALKISAIKFMKTKEGFLIDYYETDLEKHLYNEFSPLIRNVKSVTPTLFKVNNSATIYNLIQENLDFQDILDFIPPYFFYNYNIKLTLTN